MLNSEPSYYARLIFFALATRCYRIEFRILVLTFKAVYQSAPSYICKLVRLKENCKYQLCSSEELLLQLPMGKQRKLWVTEFQLVKSSY